MHGHLLQTTWAHVGTAPQRSFCGRQITMRQSTFSRWVQSWASSSQWDPCSLASLKQTRWTRYARCWAHPPACSGPRATNSRNNWDSSSLSTCLRVCHKSYRMLARMLSSWSLICSTTIPKRGLQLHNAWLTMPCSRSKCSFQWMPLILRNRRKCMS